MVHSPGIGLLPPSQVLGSRAGRFAPSGSPFFTSLVVNRRWREILQSSESSCPTANREHERQLPVLGNSSKPPLHGGIVCPRPRGLACRMPAALARRAVQPESC